MRRLALVLLLAALAGAALAIARLSVPTSPDASPAPTTERMFR